MKELAQIPCPRHPTCIGAMQLIREYVGVDVRDISGDGTLGEVREDEIVCETSAWLECSRCGETYVKSEYTDLVISVDTGTRTVSFIRKAALGETHE